MKKSLLILVITLIIITSIMVMAACLGVQDQIHSNNEVYSFNKVSSKLLGEVDRTLPQVSNEGLERYPEYGKQLSQATTQEKQAILDENNLINDYDQLDSQGNRYKNGIKLQDKLYKHSASEGLYNTTISDQAKAVAMRIRITPNSIGNNIIGLYACPGEVVTVILNENDAKRNMVLEIGQNTGRGGNIRIPTDKPYTRMPILRKQFILKETINYVGSHLGGSLYIRNEGGSLEPYEITVIGAVQTPHYIHNNTTDEQWNLLRLSAGALFDLEINPGIRFTMPASIIRQKSASEMREAADFWYKAMCLSNKVAVGEWFSKHPVTMICDTYIPAGAAVAFVGASFCVMPINWGGNALNYSQIVKAGAWGVLHEFNHHHQGWGAGNGGEVTNNVINAMTYMLYTDIATSRTESGGLTGWNWVTDAYNSLNKSLDIYSKNQLNKTLSMYTDLIHAFGSDAMIEIANATQASTSTQWYKVASSVLGYDLTYYLQQICSMDDIDQAAIQEIKAKNLPEFVPVACLYQQGYKYGDTQVEMGKPYVIPIGQQKQIDFSKYIALPSDYSFEIISVGQPLYGQIAQNDELIYTYTPNKNKLLVDTFDLKLKLTNKTSGATIEKTLILAFRQDAENIQAEIFDNPGYSEIQSALDDNFETKLQAKQKIDLASANFSSNTKNTIVKISGQIVTTQGGDYTIYIKGGESLVLFGGDNKDNMQKLAYLNKTNASYDATVQGSYFSVKLAKNQPFYFTIYLLNSNTKAFCSLGWADASQTEGAKPVQEENGTITDSEAQTVPIVDLPKGNVLNFDADVQQTTQDFVPNYYIPQYKISDLICIDNDNIKVTKAPNQYGSSKPENMLDNNKNTMMHTRVGLKFPADFTFDLSKTHKLNQITIMGRIDKNAGRIKEYKLYGGLSPLDMQLLSEGSLVSSSKQVITFDTQDIRYFNLSVLSQHGNEVYIAISEINFGIGIDNAQAIAHDNTNLQYKGKWQSNNFGTYMNGAIQETKKGEVQLKFVGTSIAMFAKKGRAYGVAEIKLDNNKWQKIDLNSSVDIYNQIVYVASGLEDGEHTLRLRADSGLVNLDYFAINATQPIPEKGLGWWWLLIGFGIASVAAAIIAVIVIAVKKKSKYTHDDSEQSVEDKTDIQGEQKQAKQAKPVANSDKASKANEKAKATSVNKVDKPSDTTQAKKANSANKSNGGKNVKNTSQGDNKIDKKK